MARAIIIAGIALALIAFAVSRVLLQDEAAIERDEVSDQDAAMPADAEPASGRDTTVGEHGARFDCAPNDPYAGLDESERLEAWKRDSAGFIDQLRVSDDAEHLVVAALLQRLDDPQASIELSAQAAAKAANNPLVTWSALQICGEHPAVCGARLGDIERRAIAADAGNAALWASVASIRQAQGDEKGALEALANAAGAPEYSAWFGESILMFDRALAAAGDRSSLHRIAAAFGFAVATPNAEIDLFSQCRDLAETSVEWRDHCLRLGETMEAHGKTLLHTVVGLKMQSTMYGIEGDTRSAAIAEEKRAALYEEMENRYRGGLDTVLSRDEAVFRTYTDVFISGGELAAMTFAGREIERLASDPGYDPCRAAGASDAR